MKYRFLILAILTFQAFIAIDLAVKSQITTNKSIQSETDNFVFKEVGFIKFPLFTTPSLLFPENILNISTSLLENVTISELNLKNNDFVINLSNPTVGSQDPYGLILIQVKIPSTVEPGLYSLYINTSSGFDFTYHSVSIKNTISSNFSIVHITDSHIGTRSYDSSRDLISAVKIINHINPEVVIHTGDLVDGGVGSKNETLINERYKEGLTILSDLNVPIFVVNGNHEDYAGLPRWNAYMGKIYQASANVGPVHIIVACSFLPRNLTWISNDLSSNNDRTTIIGYHWDYGTEFDSIGANIHILGDEHRNYVEEKPSYTRIVTGKTYYSHETEKGAIRELKFHDGKLVEYPIWDILDTPPTFTTTISPITSTDETGTISLTNSLSSSSLNSIKSSFSSSDVNSSEELATTDFYVSIMPIVICTIIFIHNRRIKEDN